jgi:hypothetical protein
MTDKSVSEGMRRLVFAVPASVAEATEAAAQQDLASISYICRRALVNELKNRGLLFGKVRCPTNFSTTRPHAGRWFASPPLLARCLRRDWHRPRRVSAADRR